LSKNLEEYGEDENLILYRLLAILCNATGLEGTVLPGSVNATSGDVYCSSASVKFPQTRVVAIDRINIWREQGRIHLCTWPAELARQYKAVYSDPHKIDALVAMQVESAWRIDPNFQLPFLSRVRRCAGTRVGT
jgi:hypothetical protein